MTSPDPSSAGGGNDSATAHAGREHTLNVLIAGNHCKLTYSVAFPSELEKVNTEIRHIPVIVSYLERKARECARMAGPDFGTVTSDDPSKPRARVWIYPDSEDAIHEELTDAVLLKAALNMEGR